MNGSGSFRNPRLQVSSGRELGFQLAWQYVLVLRLKHRRLALDVTHPPVLGDGSAFTKETFESEQASLKHPVTGTGGLARSDPSGDDYAVERLASSSISAYKADKSWLWTYKLKVALEGLETCGRALDHRLQWPARRGR